MKKIIAALFCVINIVVFFSILDIYENNDFSYINRIEIEKSGKYHEWLAFNNGSRELDSKSMIEFVQELTKQYDLLVSLRLGDFSRNQFDIYIASNQNIDKRLGLVTDSSVNFNETEDSFYTSSKSNQDGIYFYLLNDALDVNIYPITKLGELPETMLSFVSDSQSDLEESITLMTEKYGDYLTRAGEPLSTPYDVENEILDFLPITIIMAAICTFLLLMMYVQTKSKKIAVFKTMGISLPTTAFQLFYTLYIIIIMTIVMTNVLLFSIFVRHINARTIPLIMDLVKAGIYQLMGAVIAVALSCLLLNLIPTYALLKNSRFNRHLMEVNFILKIFTLVILLPMLSSRIHHMTQKILVWRYVENSESNDWQFVPRYKTEYQNDGYNFLEYLQEFRKTNDHDFIQKNSLLQEYKKAYDILNDSGAIYCKSYMLYGDESGIMVNENYMKRYPVKDVDGKWVDIDKIDADVVYLVPEYYFSYLSGEFYLTDLFDNSYEMIVIDNEQETYNFSRNWDYEFLNRPLMITLYKDTAFRLDYSIFGNVFVDADIEELLKGTFFDGKIVVWEFSDELEYMRKVWLKDILNDVRIILPASALILVIIIQYAYLYLKEFGKRIFICRLLGYHPLRIYCDLLAESGLAVLVAASVVLVGKGDVRLFPIVLGADILVYLVVVMGSANIQADFIPENEA